MNKKFATFFSETYGMEIDNALAYGKIKEYEVSATLRATMDQFPLKIHISFYSTDEQKRAIEAAIRKLALKLFKMTFTPYGLSIALSYFTIGQILKRLPTLLEQILGIISENGGLTSEFCPVCGNRLDPTTSQKRMIDGFAITLDTDCVNTINAVIEAENQDFKNAPNNYFKGFLGALIGGLAGVVIAVILYAVGFVSSLSAIVSIVAGTFLYKKFHGKPNKMMLVIVSLTTLGLMVATVVSIYVVAAGIAAQEAGVALSAFDAFRICMDDSEFSGLFYRDLGLVVLFSLIGIVAEIVIINRQIKRKQNI
ncbi:MAG: hypothetical protein K2M95_04505 [Clostridiales bacterium]|nr:hypothetical protein [Clostridiales bacterium]